MISKLPAPTNSGIETSQTLSVEQFGDQPGRFHSYRFCVFISKYKMTRLCATCEFDQIGLHLMKGGQRRAKGTPSKRVGALLS